MSQLPLALELLATDLVREYRAQADAAALADRLPRAAHSSATAGVTTPARQHLARGLRRLAARLDPSVAAASQSRLARA